jgi:hypothetical protein
MNAERTLVEWARRFQTTRRGASPQHVRQQMEETLAPMIRCALKSGLGQPVLVRWVRDHTAGMTEDEQKDPVLLAGPLAAELSAHLMARLAPQADRETVLGV